MSLHAVTATRSLLLPDERNVRMLDVPVGVHIIAEVLLIGLLSFVHLRLIGNHWD